MIDRWAWIAVLIGGLALSASYFALPVGVSQTALFLTMAAAPLVLLTARLQRESLLLHRGWSALIAGVGLYTATVFIWALLPLISEAELPFPSPLDAMNFASYLLYGLFLIRVLHRRYPATTQDLRERALPLVDAGIFAVAAMAVLWPLLFTPVAGTVSVSGSTLAVGAGYPILVSLLFGLVTQVLAAGRRPSADELLLVLWIGAELVADIFYGSVSAHGRFHFGHPMMLGWMVSYAALSAAALHPALTTAEPDTARAVLRRHRRSWLLLPVVLTPLAIGAGLRLLHADLDPTTRSAFVAFVALGIVLAFVRLHLVSGDLVEQRRLSDELLVLTEQLEDLSLHDELTGLGNRRMLFDRLRHATNQRPTRPDACTGVLMLDLDGFKAINDSLGHDHGDETLIEVARRLSAVLRPGDTLTRPGGDEFAVVLEQVDAQQAARAAQRVVEALRSPMAVNGQAVSVWASVGIALAAYRSDPQECLKHADLAMYAAKQAGGDRSAFFEATMQETVLARVRLERELRVAVEHRQLRLQYQPIVELHTGRVVGVESLVRWDHPERGLLQPCAFIEAAEESGVIVGIGRWVLEQSCRQAVRWALDEEMPPGFGIAVNVSRRQLLEPDIVDVVASVIGDTGISPDLVVLEVTETALFADTEQLVATLTELKRLGVTIAMDDFGTGHSTLQQLRELPIDQLKIDRLFITDIDQQREDYALAAAIVRLAGSLGKTVLAEGVENAAQLAHVRALNVDLAQGYLFARALDASAVADLVKASARVGSASHGE